MAVDHVEAKPTALNKLFFSTSTHPYSSDILSIDPGMLAYDNTVSPEHSESPTIAALVVHCLRAFRDAKGKVSDGDAHGACSIDDLDDLCGRFQVWAGNIAAHRRGKSSLDYRLRDASHIRERVNDLLKDLEVQLKDGQFMEN